MQFDRRTASAADVAAYCTSLMHRNLQNGIIGIFQNHHFPLKTIGRFHLFKPLIKRNTVG